MSAAGWHCRCSCSIRLPDPLHISRGCPFRRPLGKPPTGAQLCIHTTHTASAPCGAPAGHPHTQAHNCACTCTQTASTPSASPPPMGTVWAAGGEQGSGLQRRCGPLRHQRRAGARGADDQHRRHLRQAPAGAGHHLCDHHRAGAAGRVRPGPDCRLLPGAPRAQGHRRPAARLRRRSDGGGGADRCGERGGCSSGHGKNSGQGRRAQARPTRHLHLFLRAAMP